YSLTHTFTISTSLSCSLAEGLVCNSCPVGILSKCLFGSSQTCTDTNNNCYTATAGMTACTNTHTTRTHHFARSHSFNYVHLCCSTNLCNGAGSAQLSVTAAFSTTLLASAWSYM
uniref:UPAR/Ly6 domain-containing protein n=1 Tax=Electrophorus electricus TaxID=8005 RepID=A0A4W4GG91_ELEEL